LKEAEGYAFASAPVARLTGGTVELVGYLLYWRSPYKLWVDHKTCTPPTGLILELSYDSEVMYSEIREISGIWIAPSYLV
jgi:hypothetical protein